MSGGHWNYGLDGLLNDYGTGRMLIDKTPGVFDFLAAVEHELDWGISNDTCLPCAELRTVAAIKQLFDDRLQPEAAIALARDAQQNMCPKCEEYEFMRKRNAAWRAKQQIEETPS